MLLHAAESSVRTSSPTTSPPASSSATPRPTRSLATPIAGLAAGSGVGLRKWYYTSDVLIKQATGWLINDLRTFGYKPMRR